MRNAAPSPSHGATLRASLEVLLNLFISLYSLHEGRPSMAAFARTAAPPKLLLPWLHAATQLLQAVAPPAPPGKFQRLHARQSSQLLCQQQRLALTDTVCLHVPPRLPLLPGAEFSALLSSHSTVCTVVLCGLHFSAHQQTAARDMQLQETLIQRLLASLERALDSLDAAAAGGAGEHESVRALWELLAYSLNALSADCLKWRLRQQAEGAAAGGERGAAWRPLQLAVRALSLVPLDSTSPGSPAPDNFRMALLGSLALLSQLAKCHPSKGEAACWCCRWRPRLPLCCACWRRQPLACWRARGWRSAGTI